LSPNATTGVYTNLESTVFLRDNDVYSKQTTGGQSVATSAAVIRAVVLALSVYLVFALFTSWRTHAEHVSGAWAKRAENRVERA